MSSDRLSKNLRYLCSYYRSVSEVCRKVGINRQQFSRYLDGSARPSSFNLKRICDFFGLEEYELLFPPTELQRLVRIKGIRNESPETDEVYLGQIRSLVAANKPGCERYFGFYHKYYHSFSSPGMVLKSLVSIFDYDGVACYKCIERLAQPGERREAGFVFKYVGLIFFLMDRIFMVDRELLTGNEISETILYPSYKNRVGDLSGLILGASGKTSREPICSPVLMRYLGSQVQLREAMRSCGLFPGDSPAIPDSVKQAIRSQETPSLVAAPP